jgi:ADP-ribose pyrophosphatase
MEKTVYQGQIIRVTEEKINDIVWERAYLPDGVIIFPFTPEGKILMVKERRPHETPNWRIKPVSGILEPETGSPAENAAREMQEEIGLKPSELECFMILKGSGTISHTQYFFTARHLVPAKLPNPDGEETIMEVLAYWPEELLQKYLQEEIKWSHSTLGFLRLYHSLSH